MLKIGMPNPIIMSDGAYGYEVEQRIENSRVCITCVHGVAVCYMVIRGYEPWAGLEHYHVKVGGVGEKGDRKR